MSELWMEFGCKFDDVPIVFDLNGEGAVPVRGAIDITTEDGKTVLFLTNQEGAKEDYGNCKN